MRRLAITVFLLAATGSALARAQDVGSRPPLRARLAECSSGQSPAARYAVFAASMPAVPGSMRMGIRFDLLQRAPGGAFAPVAVPRWGVWERSRPGVPGFLYSKRIDALAAPAAYRALVRFRWYGPNGATVRRARRLTAICRQPDPRPDLRVGAVTARAAGDPGSEIYDVVVRNVGRGDAESFSVVLTVGGSAQPPRVVGSLAAGAHQVLEIVGPRCDAASRLQVSLDPGGAVDEANEANNVAARPCP
jgi:hypothetical protein